MRDYAELPNELRDCAICTDAGDMIDALFAAADAIEELLAVTREIAAFVIHCADDDNVSAEVLCRKLYKIGMIEKDGAWWTLPAPPKEDTP